MEADDLRRQLDVRGLQILGVGQHRADPETLVVWLHGNAGQWIDGVARRLIAGVPGVLEVCESVNSHSILRVRVQVIREGEDI